MTGARRYRFSRALRVPAALVAMVFGLSVRADAADHPVNGESDLRAAIASAASGDTITFNADVMLTQDLPAVQNNVTIFGNDKVLDGAGTYRGFFVVKFSGGLSAPVAVTIQDLTISNARARGGVGRDGGGGGAGLGGALFVADLATVTLSNVELETNSALGGPGGGSGVFGGGGGGGLGGFGGLGTGGGGGGAGTGASGGNGGLGIDGAAGIMTGLPSGGNGSGGTNAGAGGSDGGGGGGASGTSSGGGGGGVAGLNGSSSDGGRGGFGGGGGGAGESSRIGGTGGYGGGGGASGIAGSTGANSSLGGFGGGGGARAAGGFGGGSGGTGVGFPGGGGGAGLGGALFVQEGGSLTLAGRLTIVGSSVKGGAVVAGATGGSAFGSDIFLQGGGTPLTCTSGVGQTQTIDDDIADQLGSGGTQSRGLTKNGTGKLVLSGVNTYRGATMVNAGRLIVDGSITSPVTVNDTGTLGGAGTISGTVTINSGGRLSPGSSTAILHTGNLSLTTGSALIIQINGATAGAQYDQVDVTGGVTLGNATLAVAHGLVPSAGQTFTIVDNDLSDAVAGTFAGLPEGGIFVAGASRFRISYVGGSGNDVTLTALNGPPTISKSFGVATLALNDSTTLTFTLANPDSGAALTGVGFTDALPAGLVVASPNGLTGMCGGTVSAVAGGSSVALANGALAAGGSCTITVNVTGVTTGAKNNTTSAVTSNEGGTGGTASASLKVVVPPTIAKAFGVSSVPLNGTTTLTFTLTNPEPLAALTGIAFTDPLPAGLVVATPNGLTGICGGTVTAVAGGSSVALSNGTLPGSGSCTIALNVIGVTLGEKNNVTSAVTSNEGGTAGTASASIEVVAEPVQVPALSPGVLAILALLVAGAGTILFSRLR